MHILIGILAALGAAAFWIWRMRAAADATREIVDAAADARAAMRRYGYRRKTGRHPADTIEDPRLAAAGMMAAMAKLDGDMTADQMNALRVECRAAFRVEQREADEIAAYGRWLVGQAQDPGDLIRRLTRVLRDIAPREAHEDVIAMLTRIASVEGGAPSELQVEAIDQVRRGLGLA